MFKIIIYRFRETQHLIKFLLLDFFLFRFFKIEGKRKMRNK